MLNSHPFNKKYRDSITALKSTEINLREQIRTPDVNNEVELYTHVSPGHPSPREKNSSNPESNGNVTAKMLHGAACCDRLSRHSAGMISQ